MAFFYPKFVDIFIYVGT